MTYYARNNPFYNPPNAWETSLKKYLLSPSAFHQTLVTYFFVRNSQTTTTHPGLLPVHSAATLDMAASPALTLIMEKYHRQEKQDKLNITLLDSTNLTYMIQCKRCKKQYVGETKRTLRERFKEHRQATNNPLHANATAAVPSHFNQPGATRSQTWNLSRWNYNPLSACHAER